jgi:hypothetical protein
VIPLPENARDLHKKNRFPHDESPAAQRLLPRFRQHIPEL